MVQEKESFVPWSTETKGMKTRQASRQGRHTSSSPIVADISVSPNVVIEEAQRILSRKQCVGAPTGKTTSELSQRKHVQDCAGMKPRGMKQCPVVPSGTMRNKEPVLLQEAQVEVNCGDTPLPTGETPTNETTARVGSSAANLPLESTGKSISKPQLWEYGKVDFRKVIEN